MKNVIIPILVSMFVFPALASAGLQKEAAAVLINLGVSYRESGNAEEAIHEFSKALLVDPENQEAKFYLAQYGLSRGLYRPVQTSQTPFGELGQQVQSYNQKFETLNQDKLSMDSKFYELQQRNMGLRSENEIKDQQIAELNEKIDHLSRDFNSEAVAGLSQASTDKLRDHHELSTIYVGSNQLQAGMPAQNNDAVIMISSLEEHLRGAQNKMDDKDIALAKMQNQMLGQVDQAIDAHTQLITTKEKYIAQLDQSVNEGAPASVDQTVKAQLLEAQDRVSEQNSILKDQYDHMKSLEEDLKEADGQVDRLLEMTK